MQSVFSHGAYWLMRFLSRQLFETPRSPCPAMAMIFSYRNDYLFMFMVKGMRLRPKSNLLLGIATGVNDS